MNEKETQTNTFDNGLVSGIDSMINVHQEQLNSIKEELKNTNINVSDIKEKVEEIDKGIKLEKYKTQVNKFLKEHPEGWQLRIIRENSIKSTGYYPCITYIRDGNFRHILIKQDYTGEENSSKIAVKIREYKTNQFLIELICRNDDFILSPIYHRYIIYNVETYKAEEIDDPLKTLIDLNPYLNQLGYPLPKRYLKKIKYCTPFNWKNASAASVYYWDVSDYMDFSNLECLP